MDAPLDVALTSYSYAVGVTPPQSSYASAQGYYTVVGAGLAPDGNAIETHTIFLQPQRYGELWNVASVSVQSVVVGAQPNAPVETPIAICYLGVVSPSTAIGGTSNASNDQAYPNAQVRSGVPFIVQFTNVSKPAVGTPTGATGIVYCAVQLGGTTSR